MVRSLRTPLVLAVSKRSRGAAQGILWATAGLLVLTAGSAHAQTGSSGPATETQSPGDLLQEVVVTARKRAEVLQNVPESIDAFGAQDLATAHVTKIDDLGNLVSNLNIITRADNTPDVVLRGVGAFGVVTGVGFYANDVQLFDGQTVRPEDLERVEVLKGPQGTLYGGNNIGGAIKYVTKLPTDTFEASASAEAGNYDTQTYSAVLSGPIATDVLEARLSGYYTSTDGYKFDPVLGKTLDGGDVEGGRLTLVYKPSELTTATLYLNGDWNHSGGGANLYYRPQADNIYTLDLTDGTQARYGRTLYSATFKLSQTLSPSLELTSLTSYFHSRAYSVTDTDKGPLPILTGIDHFHTEVYSQELRLSNSGDGPLKWLIGLFGQGNNEEVPQQSIQFIGDPGDPTQLVDPAQFVSAFTDPVQRHQEYAVFGNATYDWQKLTFEAGVRVDHNQSNIRDSAYGLYAAQHNTLVLPKFSMSYHVSPDAMVYATFSRGFEPGDFVEGFDANGNPVPDQYHPETTRNYELGFKSTFADRVRLNGAVFYIQYNDRLFQTNVIEAGQFVGVTENIGSSHNYGAELELSARATRDLFLSASYGLTRAIWGNVPYYDSDLSAYTNLSGRSATNVPSYQASLTADWSHPLTSRLTLGARIDASFVGYSFWDVTDHYRQEPYQILNVGTRLESQQWTLSAHVSNLTDRRYNIAWISAAELGAPFNSGEIAPPRLWTVALAYHW